MRRLKNSEILIRGDLLVCGNSELVAGLDGRKVDYVKNPDYYMLAGKKVETIWRDENEERLIALAKELRWAWENLYAVSDDKNEIDLHKHNVKMLLDGNETEKTNDEEKEDD